MGDLGVEAVDAIRVSMQIDDEWSVREERGFSWWGHRLRQRVWAEPGYDDDGIEIFRLHARADLAEGVSRDALHAKLAALHMFATTSAVMPSLESFDRLEPVTSMYVHEGTFDWARRAFSFSVALQASEANATAEPVAEAFGARPAFSEHPEQPAADSAP